MTPFERLAQLTAVFGESRFKPKTRRGDIEDSAKEIAEAVAMREYAEGNDVFTDMQRRDLDKRISAHRHAILAQLTIGELKRLRMKNLQPEDAPSIFDEELHPSEEFQKLQKELHAAHNLEVSSRSYFTVSKAFNGLIGPGANLAEIAAKADETLERFKPVSDHIHESRDGVTTADAFHNHNPTRRD